MKDEKVLKAMINAKGMQITVVSDGNEDDYISLTDIAKYKNPEYPGYVIQNWMRNRSTIEFLGLWEQLNNPDFNYLEFEAIKNDSGIMLLLWHLKNGWQTFTLLDQMQSLIDSAGIKRQLMILGKTFTEQEIPAR